MPFSLQQIKAAVQNGIYEDRHLDFKQGISFDDRGKTDLCKDVAAMAFVGGHLLIGVAEKRVGNVKFGQAEKLTPLSYESKDAITLWLEQVIRDGINPRIFGTRVDVYEHDSGFVVSIYVPRSLAAPHMVKADSRCYMRGSGGNTVMDAADLRNAFLASAGYIESARKWRDQRLEKIKHRKVMPLDQGPVQVIHLIPIAFAVGHEQLPVDKLAGQKTLLRPIEKECRPDFQYNVDGYISHYNADGYVQFFRTGQLESVSVLYTLNEPARSINSVVLEKNLIELSADYLQALRNVGIDPPVMISASYFNIENFKLLNPSSSGQFSLTKTIHPNEFTLSELLVEEWSDNVNDAPQILRPIIDSVWNAAGAACSPNYAHDGAYRKDLRLGMSNNY